MSTTSTSSRKILRIVAFIILAAFLLGLGVLNLVGRDQAQSQQAAQLATSLQNEMNRVANAALDAEGLEPIERKPIVPQAKGEYGEVERFTLEFLDRLAAQNNDYAAAIEATGFFALLDPQRLGNDSTLAASRAIIDKTKATVSQHEKLSLDYVAGTGARIEALDLSAEIKQAAWAGLERGIGDSLRQMRAVWQLEMQIVLEFEKIIDVLAATGQWSVQDGQIIIESETDLARVQAQLAEIGRLSEQQEQIRQASLDKANQVFDGMATRGAK